MPHGATHREAGKGESTIYPEGDEVLSSCAHTLLAMLPNTFRRIVTVTMYDALLMEEDEPESD